MISCTRKIEFDAAHRVIGHSGKCKDVHGHRYVLEASFASDKLDNLDMVIDFGTIKRILKDWVDTNLDHNIILSKRDKELGDGIAAITKQKVYYIEGNATAENIASHLIANICPVLFRDYDVKCTRIKLYETPNCWVEIE